jgi:hypothetical protein
VNRVYALEGPVATRYIVIRSNGSISTQTAAGEFGRTDWVWISRQRAATLLWDALHSPAIVIGRQYV